MIIDGKKIARALELELKENIEKLSSKPGLAFIVIGENASSLTYVRMKKKACERIGVESFDFSFPDTTTEAELISEIQNLNQRSDVDGILVQLPLPSHIDEKKIMLAIDPAKDVDGFHPLNIGKMLLGDDDTFVSCTPLGIQTLLERDKISIEGKHVVILGRSNIVGKPLAALLMQKKKGANATVTVAHSYSRNLKEITKSADILIAAIGKPHFVTREMVKKGAVVVDVGINRITDYEGKQIIVGDVDFVNVSPIASYISPVPGGVGPMTIISLLQNTYKSYCKRNLID